jgi:hypothetical protein
LFAIFSSIRDRFVLGGQIKTLPSELIRIVALVLAAWLAELLVDLRHPKDGAMQHRLQARARERAEDFLRLA